MGKVRDLLRGVGLISSAGITVSNSGTRLLNLRNELGKLVREGATGTERLISEEKLAAYARTVARAAASPAVRKAAPRQPSGKKTAKKKRKASGGMTAAQLEAKRRYNRERMRRLRAKKA